MNISKHIACAAVFAAITATSQLGAAVVNITQGSTSGYTMTDGNTYVVQNSVSFSNSTAGGSGMTVAENATVVLYIPTNVTLTATGANGNGQTGGGAGIRVPATATLIITGEGTINATGGNAGNGGNGANGGDGTPSTYSSRSGIGGAGGGGGGGAGAAIGGCGGMGGTSGTGAVSARSDTANGNAGDNGGKGEESDTMGNVFVLGIMSLTAQGGLGGQGGLAGGFGSRKYISDYTSGSRWTYTSSGGGGGGGGGAGAAPEFAIGGGGCGGGGGGGGGSGANIIFTPFESVSSINAHGGGGNGGSSKCQAGTSGAAKVKDSYYQGGEGGSGGAAGAEGGHGTLYVSPLVSANVDREMLTATTHEAAQYTITFDANGGALSSFTNSVTATLGCALPDCIDTPFRRGFRVCSWVDDNGTQYYDGNGTSVLSSYPVPNEVVLHAVWEVDPNTAVIPNSTFWFRENADVGWFVDPDVEESDGVVLRSGAIGSNTNSWMEATFTGPSSFSFDWKVSCNTRGHYLLWSIDGVEQGRIRGVTEWTTVSASVGEGEHVVRFDYVKGSTGTAGEDKGQIRNFTSPLREETESMQILWNWTTNYLVSVTTEGFGTADFASGWILDGSNLVVNIEPSIHSYRIVLSGDTNDVVLARTQLNIPVRGAARDIAVSIEEIRPRLVIVSAQGTPTPAAGDHLFASDAEVTASVEAPDPAGGVRAVCTGWTGTGSVPSTGNDSSVTFAIFEDSSITWNWTTEYRVEFSIIGKGTTAFEAQWVADGTNLVIPFTVTAPYYTLELSGETDGAVIGNGVITVPVAAPRSIVLTVAEHTCETALDNGQLMWTSGGATTWTPQSAVSHDGLDSARSGEVTGDEVSVLSTTVIGPGTLSWWWKLEMVDCAGVDVFVDGTLVSYLDSPADWATASIQISGDGEHTVRFEFWNAGTTATISDCAYLDQVSWTGETPPLVTRTTSVPVPYSWLDTYALVSGGDYEAAAHASAANGLNKVWECYVAGLNPTNETAAFRTVISISADGAPVIGWNPDLNEGGTKFERVYTVEGRESLTDSTWAPTNSASRFFRVKVDMP